MSYTYKSQSQGAWQLTTATGNMDIAPAGSLSLKGHVIGTDIQAQNAKLQDIADASFTTNHVLYWDGSNVAGKADASEAITASAPIVRTADDLALSLDAGNLEVNGSDELAIKAGGVGATELANDAVETAKVLDGAITGPKLASDCISSAKLADDAVGSEHIQDAAVLTAALADDAVTTAKLADNLTLVDPEANGLQYNATETWADMYRACRAVATTNATPVTVGLVNVADGDVYHVECNVSAASQTSGYVAAYKAHALFKRVGSTTSQVSVSNVEIVHEDAEMASCAFDFAVDDLNDQLEASCTGLSGEAVHFSVSFCATRVA